jgi:hypothetical protein
VTKDDAWQCRFFVTYSGVRLPPRLVDVIEQEALSNRNTFIRGYFDAAGVLKGFDKVVYGEVELSHRITVMPTGVLCRAEIMMSDEEPVTLTFDEAGVQVPVPN